MRLFVYGTLLDPALLARLAGGRVVWHPAQLHGFRRVRLRGTRYPTLAPGREKVSLAPGAVFRANGAALRRLRAYEGPRYRLTPVRPRLLDTGRAVPAFAWIAPGATRLPWP